MRKNKPTAIEKDMKKEFKEYWKTRYAIGDCIDKEPMCETCEFAFEDLWWEINQMLPVKVDISANALNSGTQIYET